MQSKQSNININYFGKKKLYLGYLLLVLKTPLENNFEFTLLSHFSPMFPL